MVHFSLFYHFTSSPGQYFCFAFANPLSGGKSNPTISIITGFSRSSEQSTLRRRWDRSFPLFPFLHSHTLLLSLFPSGGVLFPLSGCRLPFVNSPVRMTIVFCLAENQCIRIFALQLGFCSTCMRSSGMQLCKSTIHPVR